MTFEKIFEEFVAYNEEFDRVDLRIRRIERNRVEHQNRELNAKLEKRIELLAYRAINAARNLINLKARKDSLVDVFGQSCTVLYKHILTEITEELEEAKDADRKSSLNRERRLVALELERVHDMLAYRNENYRRRFCSGFFDELNRMEEFEIGMIRRRVATRELEDADGGDNRCPICLQKKRCGEVLLELSCAHLYHESCGVRAVSNAKCPLCNIYCVLEYPELPPVDLEALVKI